MGLGHGLWQVAESRSKSAGGAKIMKTLCGLIVLVIGLIGCSERDQSLGSSTKKSDGKPWQGAQNAYVVKGWTPGEKTAWENQLRSRAQTQNEYVKVN
jgi:hypothetical protein